MPEWVFNVKTAAELDNEIRSNIAALDNLGRGDEIYGTLYVDYSGESVKRASLIPWLERRGVSVVWRKSAATP